MTETNQLEADAPARLAELESIDALTSRDSVVFERVTDLAAVIFDVPNVGIHLLDDERQWVKAFHGVMDTACSIEDSICRIPATTGDVAVFPDAQADPRFDENPVVWNESWPIRFYAGAPLVTSLGVNIGAFCLIDAEPRPPLTAEQTGLLRQFADLVSEMMELRRVQRTSRELLDRALEEDETTGWLSETGLLRAFYRSGAQQTMRHPLAVVDAGIEQFADLRGAYGATARSQLLRACASRLERTLHEDAYGSNRTTCDPRSSAESTSTARDQRLDGILRAHYGDGHFVIAKMFPPEATEATLNTWARHVTNAVMATFEEPYAHAGTPVHLKARVGVAIDTSGTLQPHEVVDNAHRPREAGASTPAASQVEWTDATGRERRRSRFSLDHQLRRAIRKREFYLAYQPIVELGDRTHTVGAEALLRWRQPDGTEIGPGIFIPAAEELGLIEWLDRIAVELAAETLGRLPRSPLDVWLSVNVSPQHLANGAAAYLESGASALSGMDANRLKFEITESAIAGSDRDIEHTLHRIKDAGFQLALDDFGTGHSSLARLVRLPFDALKVDRAFVADCPDGPGAAIVSSLAGLADKLSMITVGEGVETTEQETYLRDHGYALAQGYMYSRPLPEEQLIARLQDEIASAHDQ